MSHTRKVFNQQSNEYGKHYFVCGTNHDCRPLNAWSTRWLCDFQYIIGEVLAEREEIKGYLGEMHKLYSKYKIVPGPEDSLDGDIK